jgi:1,2-diacylglycerol 3-alpha-glucosyltransferase
MGAVFSAIAAAGQKHFFLVSERNDPNRYEHPKIRDFSYRFADVVVCQTPDAADSFPRGIRKKSVVIANPIDVGEVQPYDGVREKRIVTVGRLNPQKNHRLLLTAFAAFAKEHDDYVLEIYGKGELEGELKAYAKELKIDDRVVFKGFSNHVKEEINRAAMFVLSSDYEGISNSMTEAMALGVPTISTDCPIGGSKMFIRDHQNGLLTPVGDADALVTAMSEIADDPELGCRLGIEGRKLKQQLNVERIADEFLAASRTFRSARTAASVPDSGSGAASRGTQQPKNVLILNPILYTAEHNDIPRVSSIKDTMIYTLCLGFQKAGCQVTLIAAQDYKPREEESYPFPVIWMRTVCKKVFQPRCFPYMPALRKFLREHDEYDLIITSELFATWSYTAVRLRPEKTIVWHELAAHNRLLHQFPSRFWYGFVVRTLMGRARVVPRSRAARDFVGQFATRVSETTIDHGVDLEQFNCYIEAVPSASGADTQSSVLSGGEEASVRKNQFVVVSQLIPRKQIHRTIEAFADFVAGSTPYKLYIIGQGEEESRLKETAVRRKVEELVIFCGQMSHEQLLPIVAASKALLVYTKKDNNMVSVAESIAVGTPVVTTSVPYNAEYIQQENLGIVKDDWGADELRKICEENDTYVTNCQNYRHKLSNVYCAESFLHLDF